MTARLSSLALTRVSGAGNTFYIINNLDNGAKLSKEQRSKFVRRVCTDPIGAATDGLLFLDSHPELDFAWDFYNSDGSNAEMCGNAARCAAFYFHVRIEEKRNIMFATIAGEISAEILAVDEPWVEVKMPRLKSAPQKLKLTAGGKKIEVFSVNTGVPHVIIEGDPDFELGQKLRRAPELGVAGSNITFVERDHTQAETIQAITFERGVENFTLSCGTGAVAAAEFQRAGNPDQNEVWIEMPGGALRVRWVDSQAFLAGPVELQFEAHFFEEFL